MSNTTPTSLFVVELEPRTTPAAVVAPQATPADPSVGSQWGLTAISAPRGWDTATGTGRTIVAVIDTGVDLTHPDLRANLWTNPGEIAGNGRDDDGNGYTDDVHGWDFAGNDNDPTDERGHGTHVAGIIGAVGNNGVGGSGVAWKTRIMPLKMFDANGGGNTGSGARAIDYAVRNGAKIINCSWGGSAPDDALAAAIARAQAAGVIVVIAAGNAGRNNDTNSEFPANYANSYTNVVAVAASTQNGQLASWSNYSTSRVELAAPGEGIVSTARGGGTTTKSGTSMSAPFVSGALAVLWDKHPTWTWQQVLAKLRSSVDVVAGMIGKTVTGGVLNLAKLLEAPVAPPVVPPPPVAPPTVVPPPVSPPAGTGVRWTGAGARVVSGQFLGSAAGTFDRVRVAFDKRMNAPTFTAADVSLTGPAGAITVNGVSLVAGTDGTTFDVTFARQTAAGSYTVRVGPDVWDVTAQRMDQNGNGVNNETADRYTLSATLGGSGANVAAIPGVLSGNSISDYRTTRATFAVTASKTVIDVSVTVDVSHARTSDLQIRLTSPSGKQVVLFNRKGGANLAGATFTTGAFAGLNSKGDWRLEVFDVVSGEGGSIRSAGLTIQ
jgi:serine protease